MQHSFCLGLPLYLTKHVKQIEPCVWSPVYKTSSAAEKANGDSPRIYIVTYLAVSLSNFLWESPPGFPEAAKDTWDACKESKLKTKKREKIREIDKLYTLNTRNKKEAVNSLKTLSENVYDMYNRVRYIGFSLFFSSYNSKLK